MLDQQDMTLLRGMFDDILTQRLGQALKQNNIDLKREIRDEVHALISASENRMLSRMGTLQLEITDFLDQAILPQIHELQTDMALVKNHLKLA